MRRHGLNLISRPLALEKVVPLNQVNERENQDPDQVDEMPVQSRDFDQVGLRLRQLAGHAANQQHAVVHDAAENVTAVKAGQDEERRVEQVDLNRHPFFAEQVMPLERLHPEEHYAAENRQRHEVAI